VTFGRSLVCLCLISACSGTAAEQPARPQSGCGSAVVAISQIQGTGAASPFVGQTLQVEGVVTAHTLGNSGEPGFYLESEAPDADPASSEGLLVLAPREQLRPEPGRRTWLRGRVAELRGVTALDAVEVISDCGAARHQPSSIEVAGLRGTDAGAAAERWENMWVRSDEIWTLLDASHARSRGEVTGILGNRPYAEGHELYNSSPEAALPYWVIRDTALAERAWTLPSPSGLDLRAGARATQLSGIVQLESGVKSILATSGVDWQSPTVTPPPSPRPRQLRVAALNVHNYFVQLGSLGATTQLELDRQRQKLVSALLGLDADIVGLVELENRELSSASDLARAVNERLGADRRYELSRSLPPPGSAISVGLLYRPLRARPLGEAWFDESAIFRRAPLFQSFAVGAVTLSVGVVHLKSKRCDGEDPDSNASGEGCGATTRLAEVRQLLERTRDLPPPSSSERLLLIGDFNCNPREAPVQTLLQNGWGDLLAELPATDRYSYVYQGRASLLDYAFGTPALESALSYAAIWHVNADEPMYRDYRVENPSDPGLTSQATGDEYTPDAARSSDHDPILVDLDLAGLPD
jgi:predicted extracellular nuclease